MTYLFRLLLSSISLQRATSTDFTFCFRSGTDNPEWSTKLCQNNGYGPQGAECVDATQYANGIFIASPQNMTKDIITRLRFFELKSTSVLTSATFTSRPKRVPFCHSHIMGDKPGRNCTTTYACGPSSFLANLRIFLKNLLYMTYQRVTRGYGGVISRFGKVCLEF